jgi:hypothetical protein
MIRWPANDALTKTASANLDRLKTTTICHELEEDGLPWKLQSWAWSSHAPWRWSFEESETCRRAIVTMTEDGLWTVQRMA